MQIVMDGGAPEKYGKTELFNRLIAPANQAAGGSTAGLENAKSQVQNYKNGVGAGGSRPV